MDFQKINKVILDANVLYPAPLRDFLLNLAIQDLFIPQWTNQIQFEWSDNLLTNRPDLKKSQLDRTIRLMNEVFPKANVVNYKKLEKGIKLPDANDKHVLAAAIKSNSGLIVTFNIKDFPKKELKKYEVERIQPDEFIMNLMKLDKSLVIEAFNNQLESLKNPSKTKLELLTILNRNNLSKTVGALREVL